MNYPTTLNTPYELNEMDEKAKFVKGFRMRLKIARESQELTQADVAGLLGIPLDRYKKYESRGNSLFPIYLLPRLCEITGHSPWFFLTGKPASSEPRRGIRAVK